MVDQYIFSGSLPENASTYVTREADAQLYEGLKEGKFCYVLNSRQSGKSSLRVRTMQRLRDDGLQCVAVDLSAGGIQNVPAEQWYADLIDTLIDSFGLNLDFADWWSENQLNSLVTRFRKFLEEVLLVEVQENIVIFIDEIDSVLSLNFSTDDFFALIRACYNKRVDNPEYNRLTFCLLGVASPSNLIEDKQRTPFNIGQAISLKGFQLHEVEPLEKGLRDKFANPKAVIEEILIWTGGQPFLTQKLCHLLLEEYEKNDFVSVSKVVKSYIIDNWESQDEPEHLKTIRDRIFKDNQRVFKLLELYKKVLTGGEVLADEAYENIELRLSGLVIREHEKLTLYNRIYKYVFSQNWINRALADLRPYAEALSAWSASNYKDEAWLLRGQILQDAIIWASDKYLSDLDYRFLNASQKLETRELQSILEIQVKTRDIQDQINLILADIKHKAQKKVLLKKIWQNSNLIIATNVAVCVMLLHSIGLLQSLELAALDQFFRLHPNEPPEDRITIVVIDEAYLNEVRSWPIPDAKIAQLLQKLNVHKPRAIGLNIYRNLPVEPGNQELRNVYQSTPNLIGIELLGNDKNFSVSPPLGLNPDRVGFNNVLYDLDGKVRRSLLYWHVKNEVHESFALKLALLYLKSKGITPTKAKSNPEYLQLGKAVFTRFEANDGAYVGADDRGYQILSNFPKRKCQSSSGEFCSFRQVSIRDVLADKVKANLIKDRIILIGSTAPSLQDFVFIPYSSSVMGTAEAVPHIQLQAYLINELISAAVDGRPLLKVWPDLVEYLWIFAFSLMGCIGSLLLRSLLKFFLIILFFAASLTSVCYLSFLYGWWLPFFPPLFSLIVSIFANLIEHIYQLLKVEKLELSETLKLILEAYQDDPTAYNIAIEYLKTSLKSSSVE
ncbi:CHASE2 domain-containing protein [Nostoc sp. DedQUE07]|uniref:CHASE2 domain-containing protein n=1 Tax=Nostoc sp. DedQUE07 TaxID=3075392 RepID=UPI002AD342EE|nr:CHASE2 domain-containing protein [Nostoc sp. DedQUE07]MDZ8131978.1 CHASE2 domain-containing protein [Nostoc sp. DedQUE07]